jgi:hypothetical protein
MNDPKRIIIVFLGAAMAALCFFGIKGHIDSEGYKKQFNYVTAVQATDADHFNYDVDSQQGRVLSSGTFIINPKESVKFDEMNKSYGYVKRTEEHYTMHTRESCSTDSDGNEHCHTETYYTWDSVNDDVKQSPNITYFGRTYPIGLFRTGQFIHDQDCEEFMKSGSGGGWFDTKKGCLEGDNYIDDDNRYTYDVMPLTFSGTFLASTEGGLHPLNEDAITLEQKNIPQVLKDVGQYRLVGFWVLTVLLIIVFIGACFAAYAWVMQDGIWSLYR